MPTKWTEITANIADDQDITSLNAITVYEHDGSDIEVRFVFYITGLADASKVIKLHAYYEVTEGNNLLLKPIARVRYDAGEISPYIGVRIETAPINLKNLTGDLSFGILSTDPADDDVDIIYSLEQANVNESNLIQINGSGSSVTDLLSQVAGIKSKTDSMNIVSAPTLPVTPAHQYIAGVGITESGGAITTWADQVGSQDLTQNTAGNRPTRETIEGVTSVKFTKLNEQFMDIPTGVSINPQDFTMMVVYKPTSGDAVGSTSSQIRRRGGLVAIDNAQISAHLSNGGIIAGKTDGNTVQGTGVRTSLGYGVLIMRGTATEATLYYGRESYEMDAHDNNTPLTSGWIGRLANATGGTDDGVYLDGHIVEVVIFGSALSDSEIQLLQDYGTQKYNALSRSETFSLVIAGDSLTDGTGAVIDDEKNGDLDWVSMLARTCGNQPKIIHKAVGGWSVTDEIAADRDDFKGLVSENSEYSTRVTMLWGGINDIVTDGKSIAELTTGTDGIADWIADIKSEGDDVRVVLATITPSLSLTTETEAIRQGVNDWIRNQSEADLVVDLAAHRNLIDANNSTYYSDQVHFTAEGYKVIAHAVHAAFLNKGWVIDDIKSSIGDLKVTLDGEFVQLSEQFMEGVRYAMLSYSGLAEKVALDSLVNENHYQCRVVQIKDDEDNRDEYTVLFFKNTSPILSEISGVSITLTARSDGSTLVSAQTMTQIGSTGVFKYNEPTNRVQDGETYIVTILATIDGELRTLRDSF